MDSKRKYNFRKTGSMAEEAVCNWLSRQGVKIYNRNFHARTGEIDIVAYDGAYLLFIEVKYRRGEKAGAPAEAVTASKIRKISSAALFYMTKYKYSTDTPVRFDVAEVFGTEELTINYIENAFDFCV